MRRVSLALTLFLLLAAAPTARPTDPRGTAPVADPFSLTDLAFPTSTAGWVLASGGLAGAEVLATRDAGVSWAVQWAGSLVPEQIVATDPSHAWVLGQRCAAETCGSELLSTVDGGEHWSGLGSLPLHIDQVAFRSPSVGIAGARAASCRDTPIGPPRECPGWVLLTHDGGLDWRPVMKLAEPIVAVATRAGRLWALDAAPGGEKSGLGTYPPSLVVFSSRDGGRTWSRRGAVHPPMLAGLDVEAQLVPGLAGRLWLSALDPHSCAMHGCGLDGAWSSADAGRRWRSLDLPDPFERGIGMPCGYSDPMMTGGKVAASFNVQDCAGPRAALYRLDGSRPKAIHLWKSFTPIALAWPSPSVGYTLSQQSLQRSTDGGRRWREVSFGS